MATAAFGQQLGKLGQMQQENAEKMREYSWKSRTEIRKGGETKIVRLDQVRYAVDGSLQKTQLSATTPDLPTGGLRGMIAKKKKEEFTALIDGLTTLAKSYGKLPPEKMQRFMTSAAITPEATVGQAKLLRIQGTDVLEPGDSMTIWIDVAARKQRRIEVRTAFEGKPVRIVSEFQDLPEGPTYLARATIEYTEAELVVTTDNFDHMREQRVGGGAR